MTIHADEFAEWDLAISQGEFEDAKGAKSIGSSNVTLASLLRPSTTPLETAFGP